MGKRGKWVNGVKDEKGGKGKHVEKGGNGSKREN